VPGNQLVTHQRALADGHELNALHEEVPRERRLRLKAESEQVLLAVNRNALLH
jgi:hypothetical protein